MYVFCHDRLLNFSCLCYVQHVQIGRNMNFCIYRFFKTIKFFKSSFFQIFPGHELPDPGVHAQQGLHHRPLRHLGGSHSFQRDYRRPKNCQGRTPVRIFSGSEENDSLRFQRFSHEIDYNYYKDERYLMTSLFSFLYIRTVQFLWLGQDIKPRIIPWSRCCQQCKETTLFHESCPLNRTTLVHFQSVFTKEEQPINTQRGLQSGYNYFTSNCASD